MMNRQAAEGPDADVGLRIRANGYFSKTSDDENVNCFFDIFPHKR